MRPRLHKIYPLITLNVPTGQTEHPNGRAGGNCAAGCVTSGNSRDSATDGVVQHRNLANHFIRCGIDHCDIAVPTLGTSHVYEDESGGISGDLVDTEESQRAAADENPSVTVGNVMV